jgi:hypothetical protein
MPPRSFSIFQPVHSHPFADFGLSGGVEGLRWIKSSQADPIKFADSIVHRGSEPHSQFSLLQIRTSTFSDEPFSPPSFCDVQHLLGATKNNSRIGCKIKSNPDFDFSAASISQKEIMNLCRDSTNERVKEWRDGCNNSSSLVSCEILSNPYLFWTTGCNGQFLMHTPLDISAFIENPSSALNASLPALDSSSLPDKEGLSFQRISDIEVS